jgi:hypothetical protein
MMRLGPAFPTWRNIWKTDEELNQRLGRIDRLRELRSLGNFSLPSIPRDLDRAALRTAFDNLNRIVVSGEEEHLNLSDDDIGQIIAAIAPVLPPIRWARWLYLEKALEQATLEAGRSRMAVELRRMCGEFLLGGLADRGFLPGHGFPTDVVSFMPGKEFKSPQDTAPDGARQFRTVGPQRSLDLAIRDYAQDRKSFSMALSTSLLA